MVFKIQKEHFITYTYKNIFLLFKNHNYKHSVNWVLIYYLYILLTYDSFISFNMDNIRIMNNGQFL